MTAIPPVCDLAGIHGDGCWGDVREYPCSNGCGYVVHRCQGHGGRSLGGAIGGHARRCCGAKAAAVSVLLDRILLAYWADRAHRRALERATDALWHTALAVFHATSGEWSRSAWHAGRSARAGAETTRLLAIEVTARLGLAVLPLPALEGR